MLSPLGWSVSHTFGVCCSTSPVRADGDLTLCPGQVAKLRILICQQSGFVQVCAFLARILRNLRTAPVPAFSSPADSSVLGQPVAQQRCPQQDSVQAKPRDSLETGTPGRSAMVMTEVTRRLACRPLLGQVSPYPAHFQGSPIAVHPFDFVLPQALSTRVAAPCMLTTVGPRRSYRNGTFKMGKPVGMTEIAN